MYTYSYIYIYIYVEREGETYRAQPRAQPGAQPCGIFHMGSDYNFTNYKSIEKENDQKKIYNLVSLNCSLTMICCYIYIYIYI